MLHKIHTMFSLNQKRQIADAVQKVLRDTNHPELPEGEIQFSLHVDGAESWSWADIRNNGDVPQPGVNQWNEIQDSQLGLAMQEHGETWADVESHTLTDEQLNTRFSHGYGGTERTPFTLWTKQRVYFPWQYDGAKGVASVSRNPDGKATEHVGG